MSLVGLLRASHKGLSLRSDPVQRETGSGSLGSIQVIQCCMVCLKLLGIKAAVAGVAPCSFPAIAAQLLRTVGNHLLL